MNSGSEKKLSMDELLEKNRPAQMVQTTQPPAQEPTPPSEVHPTKAEWEDLMSGLCTLGYHTERQTGYLKKINELLAQLPTRTQMEELLKAVKHLEQMSEQAGKRNEKRFSLSGIRLPRPSLPYIPWICLDCGGTMVLHRAHTMDAVKNNFMCSAYKKKGKDVCSGHYIREQELSAILLDDIRRVTHFARQNELRFAEHIRKKQGKEAQQEITVLQKKIDTMQKRQAELTKLFKRLYEDSVLGRIPDEQYRILSQEYTAEQKEIQEQLPAMETRLQELKDSSSNIARFIENAKRYSEIPELTAEILRIFIKRVEVGERAEKYSRTAPQEVRIYYRDIGLVDELPQSMADSVAEAIQNEVA